jgi:hypothetical protein
MIGNASMDQLGNKMSLSLFLSALHLSLFLYLAFGSGVRRNKEPV